MRNIIFTFIISLNFVSTKAQDLPRLDPMATIEQRVGLTWITLNHARPAVRARKIWGTLIPYDHPWQIGTHEPTIIIFDDDVIINNHHVERGQYTLYVIPGKDTFRFILNSNTVQWRTFEYNKNTNVLEFDVNPTPSNFKEHLQFSFKDFSKNTAQICLEWEKLELCFEVETEIKEKALKNIEEAIRFSQPDDYMVYLIAVNYAIETGEYLAKAENWANDAVKISNNAWDALWLRANLYAKNNDFLHAVKFGEKCLAAIPSKDNKLELIDSYTTIIQKWKKHKK